MLPIILFLPPPSLHQPKSLASLLLYSLFSMLKIIFNHTSFAMESERCALLREKLQRKGQRSLGKDWELERKFGLLRKPRHCFHFRIVSLEEQLFLELEMEERYAGVWRVYLFDEWGMKDLFAAGLPMLLRRVEWFSAFGLTLNKQDDIKETMEKMMDFLNRTQELNSQMFNPKRLIYN